MKILAIGNSFSQDATAYLYEMAASDGLEINLVNLYIGGCSLETHWSNIQENQASYMYQRNGKWSEQYISIRKALLEEDWDIVTLQQCSGYSGLPDTYHPYIEKLSEYVKVLAPYATQYIHQTWAYEIDSDHGHFEFYHNKQQEMYDALKNTNETVAKTLGFDLIPCGDVIQTLRQHPLFDYQNGGKSLCRDGFHMHEIYGRYALAATWYSTLLDGNVLSNSYIPPTIEGISITDEELQVIKNCVNQISQRR